jgi:hypothetical protein
VLLLSDGMTSVSTALNNESCAPVPTPTGSFRQVQGLVLRGRRRKQRTRTYRTQRQLPRIPSCQATCRTPLLFRPNPNALPLAGKRRVNKFVSQICTLRLAHVVYGQRKRLKTKNSSQSIMPRDKSDLSTFVYVLKLVRRESFGRMSSQEESVVDEHFE